MCRVLPHSLYGKMDNRKPGLPDMSRSAWNPMDYDNNSTMDPYKVECFFFESINAQTIIIGIVFEYDVFYLQIF
jgi:hypothetical protein